MLKHELLRDKAILIVSPEGPLQASDFEALAREVDPYIEQIGGGIAGLMIYTKSFPGWEDFAALIGHMRFVKDHHHKIEKVAAVTDSKFMAIAPKIVDHLVSAEVRHFDFDDRASALAWLES